MLNKELITGQSVLASLTDEQITAIETLSKNDENTVIAKKVAEIHKAYDDDIKEVTGKEKPTTMKTYDFLKKTLKESQDAAIKAKDLAANVETLKTEKASLEKQIKEGSNDVALKSRVAELEQSIKDSKSQVTKLQNDIVTTKESYEAKLKSEQESNTAIRLSVALAEVRNDVTLKDIPEAAKEALLENIEKDLLSKGKIEFREDKSIVFRDENDNIITNPNNLQNPYTAKEMYLDALKKSELVDEGREGKGGGAKPRGSDGKVTLDLGSAKSKHSAREQIRNYLIAEGVPQGSEEFQQQMVKIEMESNIGDLPMQDPS
jgi:hypothetical protein